MIGGDVPTSTERFFGRLAKEESLSVLGSAKGTIRFELVDGRKTEHWRLAVNRGAVEVSRSDEAADCVIRAKRSVFEEIADGRMSALPAVLRGMVGIEGDPTLLVRFQRLFPAGERQPMEASARTVGRQRS
jgi:putative sterol carrier protein